jgi:hypothetical protein
MFRPLALQLQSAAPQKVVFCSATMPTFDEMAFLYILLELIANEVFGLF